jgi:6-phosphogluconolactonase
MKFTKFGKALLMSALSVAVVLSVTSCIQSYSVGYLYVTGTVTAGSSSNGIITGFKINHNTGQLTPINGLPISSGGANPGRAVLIDAGRFLYVLNRGTNSSNGANCTVADPCLNANITQFAVGGNGILTPQETFYTQGANPFRILADSAGNFIYVLDHDSPDNIDPAVGDNCNLALANDSLGNPITSCGDITTFKVDQTTGRLSLVVNTQVSTVSSSPLSYFPVPANPIDFVMTATNALILSGTPITGDSVFPYTYNGSSGQLSVNSNSSQPLSNSGTTNGLVDNATAIILGSGYIYVLDNEPLYNTATSPATLVASSQIFPFTVGTNGALQSQTGGAVADDATLSNPNYLIIEAKGKWAYVLNQGNNTDPNNTQSGIAGYVIDPSTHQLSFIAGEPFGTGPGPQCIVEDPSDQFIYTANYNDSTVTGRVIDQVSGVLDDMRVASSYSLTGPPAWCLVTGRVS